MYITPEFSIVLSFFGFVYIFIRKVYPIVIEKIDEYIESIKLKIQQAETEKDNAYLFLKQAYVKKDDTEEIIKLNRAKSEEKIKHLKTENEKLLDSLNERYEASIKMQLEAEYVKQKNQLIERMSDVVIEKLSEIVLDAHCEVVTSFRKEDLLKLSEKSR
jgi:F0F1-type ATP synthase membrane subunit b/b'